MMATNGTTSWRIEAKAGVPVVVGCAVFLTRLKIIDNFPVDRDTCKLL